jgi:protein-S-isoprenylcysteine O-methyltransferase Ste14
MKVAFVMIVSAVALKIFVFQTASHSIIHDFWGQLGLLVVLIGTLLRSWAAGLIKKNRVLMMEGPYHLCRNPLYLGSFLISIGFTIILREVYLWAMLALFIMMYIPKIREEEKKLTEIFAGDFQDYKKVTGMFYPKSFCLKKLRCEWSYSQWVKNGEYNAWIAVVIGCSLLEVWTVYLASLIFFSP